MNGTLEKTSEAFLAEEIDRRKRNFFRMIISGARPNLIVGLYEVN